MKLNVLLVGHRGTGKTVTGALAAQALGWQHVDLDQAIEQRTGQRCEALVADDESRFREIEIETLADLLRGDRVVVSAGGGLEEIPPNVLTVWLQRDGWEETAASDRVRLRPQMSWEQEVEWMCLSREPRWLTAAHLLLHVPRARTVERVARDLATYVRWVDAGLSEHAKKTWVIAESSFAVVRAAADAVMFGFLGVEVRSDLVERCPPLDVPVLASLRTPDTQWLRSAAEAAAAIDVDIALLDTLFESGVLDATPRRLLISTHPTEVDPADVTTLVDAMRRLHKEASAWAPFIELKYAPQVKGVADIGLGRALIAPLRRAGFALTYLPQGANAAWARPLLLQENHSNYVTTHVRPQRAGVDGDLLTPWDLMDWLPHLAAPAPTTWDALVGDPVEASQGDLWHRREAIEAGEAAGYVKVPTTAEDFEATLTLLAELGVRGVSVTSPHKTRVAFISTDDAVFGELLSDDARWAAAKAELPIRIGNTLLRHRDRWLATDTDQLGMAATLSWLEQQGIGPATIAMFGSGGVTPALFRAIKASDWFIVFATRARDGWPADVPPFVTVVINAAGSATDSRDGAPRSRAWVDLHYTTVAEAPAGALHVAGDIFFDAQAAAQRSFWNEVT